MRGGFIARGGFSGIGRLSVSRGYGPIPSEEEEELGELTIGTALRIKGSARSFASPKVLITRDDKKKG